MKKCPICNKEFDGKKEKSALRLHMIQSHKKYIKNGEVVDCKKKVSSEPTEQKSDCDHEWKLLNSNLPDQKRAKDFGFIKYCTKCEELI